MECDIPIYYNGFPLVAGEEYSIADIYSRLAYDAYSSRMSQLEARADTFLKRHSSRPADGVWPSSQARLVNYAPRLSAMQSIYDATVGAGGSFALPKLKPRRLQVKQLPALELRGGIHVTSQSIAPPPLRFRPSPPAEGLRRQEQPPARKHRTRLPHTNQSSTADQDDSSLKRRDAGEHAHGPRTKKKSPKKLKEWILDDFCDEMARSIIAKTIAACSTS